MGVKKGITNQACKREFFADRMNHRFQRQLILGKLLGISGNETLLNPGVVNAQELVLSSGHVDEIRLALGPLLVQELVHRLGKGSLAEIGANDLVQCLAQVRRAPLRCGITLEDVFSRVIHRWINTGKAHDGTAVREPAHITNLRHQLDSSGFAHTVYGPDRFILWELPGQPGLGGGQLLCCGRNEQFGVAVPGQSCNMTHAVHIQFRRFPLAEFDKTYTYILLAYHEKQKRWIPPGSHIKGTMYFHEEVLKSAKQTTLSETQINKAIDLLQSLEKQFPRIEITFNSPDCQSSDCPSQQIIFGIEILEFLPSYLAKIDLEGIVS